MSRQNPRRPSSSRTPVSRPRRVAGQTSSAPESSAEAAETPAGPPAGPPDEPPAPPTEPREPSEPPDEEPDAPDAADTLHPAPGVLGDRRGLAALFDSRRVTSVLVSVIVVLALAAGGLFTWNAVAGDDEASPSKQPVVVSSDDATDAVDAAAKAAETIVATSYQDYDKQVDEATALMTDAFAKTYRQTAEDIKADFVATKTEIQVRIVAQGIVHATRTEVQALLFLNQYVSKDGGDTTYTPYRALVTVVHTDRGWLVSNLDTK
jgi:Mce-associated membrane protein